MEGLPYAHIQMEIVAGTLYHLCPHMLHRHIAALGWKIGKREKKVIQQGL